MFAAVIAAALALTPPAAAPALTERAILPAEATAPAPGEPQPVGGFSALLDAPGRDTYFAMPDNGFGTKANSGSFLLRLYRVRTNWETARGGRGEVRILDWVTLRDPDERIPFELVNEDTPERLLTGGDFDPESVRRDRRGDLWFGDEFGPFLLHTDARGKVLEAPIPLPGVRSPDYPSSTPAPNLARSNGFEGMALSRDGRTLYPALEGPVTGDDPSTRRVYEFDLRARRYATRHRIYRVADPGHLVSDLTALDDRRLVSLERDNFEGPAARHKRGFVVDLRTLAKRPVVDLLSLRDPKRISEPARAGDFGIGDPFAMPYQTIEAVLPVGDGKLAIVNDTNFGSRGRNPGLPDYSDFIQVRVPGLPGS